MVGSSSSAHYQHRSTYKQKNKPFKAPHASKRSLKAKSKGRTGSSVTLTTASVAGNSTFNSSSSSFSTPSSSKSTACVLLRRNRVVGKRAPVLFQSSTLRPILSKVERTKNSKHMRKLYLAAVKERHKTAGLPGSPPKLVAVIPLCADIDVSAAIRSISLACLPAEPVFRDNRVLLASPFRNQAIELMKPRGTGLLPLLDCARAADFLVFVLSARVEVDSFGETVLSSLLAQGVPDHAACLVQHLETESSPKMQAAIRASLLSYLTHWLPTAQKKVYALHMEPDCKALLRFLSEKPTAGVLWRDQHPFLIVDEATMVPNQVLIGSDDSAPDSCNVTIVGYLRGNNMSANRLVHIPDVGDFQIISIAAAPQSRPKQSLEIVQTQVGALLDAPGRDGDDFDDQAVENDYDMMQNEQTWPTEEEMAAGDARLAELQAKKRFKRVPKGTSSYQAEWIFEDDDDEGEENVVNDDDDDDDNDYFEKINHDHIEPKLLPRGTRTLDIDEIMKLKHAGKSDSNNDLDLDRQGREICVKEFLQNSHKSGKAKSNLEEDTTDTEYEIVEMEDKASLWDAHTSVEEQLEQRRKYMEKQQLRQAEDREFPDEVDTPLDISARVRFQKYRGLASFHKSPWDPYENLPLEMGRLFRFQNYQAARNRVLKLQHAAPVTAGQRVAITLKNVPSDLLKRLGQSGWCVYGLLRYENKHTLLHFSISHRSKKPKATISTKEFDSGVHSDSKSTTSTVKTNATNKEIVPIKSKDEVILLIGFRRYRARPVYSEDSRDGGNHVFKYLRFLQPGMTALATVIGPATFQGPVLMFSAGNGDSENVMESGPVFMGAGSVVSGENDFMRIVAKRVMLTGIPHKIHKRGVVVRYMFHNTADIEWFKPVQLQTKYGHIGHIKDTLGTHGYMKCVFDGHLEQNDTICMPLYKRVFPKLPMALLGSTELQQFHERPSNDDDQFCRILSEIRGDVDMQID